MSAPQPHKTTLEKIKSSGTITIGTSAAYAPFEFIADGKLVGYDIDLANEIAKRMGVKIAWQEIDCQGIVAARKSKRVDALFTGLTKTKEREEQIGFSNSYYDAGIGAAKPIGSPMAPHPTTSRERLSACRSARRGRHSCATISPISRK